MKKYLLLFSFSILSLGLCAQNVQPEALKTDSDSKIIYIDDDGMEVRPEKAKTIRVIQNYNAVLAHYKVIDYYKSGAKKAVGTYLDNDARKRDGQFVSYYENGIKKNTVHYKDGKKDGKEFRWYKDGKPNAEFDYYKEDSKNGTINYKINQYWDDFGVQQVTDAFGEYEENNKSEETKGKILNGLHSGTWTGKDKKRNFSYTEEYQNNFLTNGTSVDSTNIKHQYTVVFENANPTKGLQHFYKYIASNLKIPKYLKGVSGKIFVGFTVNIDGSIANLKIIKGIHPDIDQEAIRTIASYKNWNPGLLRGIPIAVKYTLPLNIKN